MDGWAPAIEPNTLCFLAGTVSAWQPARRSYLVEGVAIHGVSGGPVFHCPSHDEVRIIGSISAYHANQAAGAAHPGLLRAQDVSHFHGVASYIRSVDKANAKKREFEAAQKLAAESGSASVALDEATGPTAGMAITDSSN